MPKPNDDPRMQLRDELLGLVESSLLRRGLMLCPDVKVHLTHVFGARILRLVPEFPFQPRVYALHLWAEATPELFGPFDPSDEDALLQSARQARQDAKEDAGPCFRMIVMPDSASVLPITGEELGDDDEDQIDLERVDKSVWPVFLVIDTNYACAPEDQSLALLHIDSHSKATFWELRGPIPAALQAARVGEELALEPPLDWESPCYNELLCLHLRTQDEERVRSTTPRESDRLNDLTCKLVQNWLPPDVTIPRHDVALPQ